MLAHVDEIPPRPLFARFFALFDTDRSGAIDEEEFIAGLGALMGSSACLGDAGHAVR